jgi:hypothetical protein
MNIKGNGSGRYENCGRSDSGDGWGSGMYSGIMGDNKVGNDYTTYTIWRYAWNDRWENCRINMGTVRTKELFAGVVVNDVESLQIYHECIVGGRT